jgi:hypothetical protein
MQSYHNQQKNPLLDLDIPVRMQIGELIAFLAQTWGSYEFIRYYPNSDELYCTTKAITPAKVSARTQAIQEILSRIFERAELSKTQTEQLLQITKSKYKFHFQNCKVFILNKHLIM